MNEIDLIHFYEHGEVVVACGRLLTESSLQVICDDDLVVYNLIGMTKQLPTVDVVVVGLLDNNSIRVADIFPIFMEPAYSKLSSGRNSVTIIPGSFLGSRFVDVETGLGAVHLAILEPSDVQESPRVGYSIISVPMYKISNNKMVYDNTMVLSVPFFKRKSAPVFLLDGCPAYFPEEKKYRASGHQVGYPYKQKTTIKKPQ